MCDVHVVMSGAASRSPSRDVNVQSRPVEESGYRGHRWRQGMHEESERKSGAYLCVLDNEVAEMLFPFCDDVGVICHAVLCIGIIKKVGSRREV